MKTASILGTAAALLIATSAAAAAADGPAAKPAPKNNCFSTRDWQGWSAPGDGDTLYLKVGRKDVYQIDLVPGSHVRKDGDTFLISRSRGSSFVCSAIDLDLALSDHSGFKQPVMAKTMRKLTPEEVAAIPAKDRP